MRLTGMEEMGRENHSEVTLHKIVAYDVRFHGRRLIFCEFTGVFRLLTIRMGVLGIAMQSHLRVN